MMMLMVKVVVLEEVVVSRCLLAGAILSAASPHRGRGLSMLRGCGAGEIQDVSGNPAFHGGGLFVGGAIHQKHVVLIGREDLHHFPLRDADFVLFEGRVILHNRCHAVISLCYQNQRLKLVSFCDHS